MQPQMSKSRDKKSVDHVVLPTPDCAGKRAAHYIWWPKRRQADKLADPQFGKGSAPEPT